MRGICFIRQKRGVRMKKKHMELLQYLLDHPQTSTSKELAAALGMSQRSIKNYVMEINLHNSEQIILSSKSGYTLNTQAAHALLQHDEEQLPQTWEERASYIIKQLMLEHTNNLDLYQLCDQLYVGYSTLKSDISRMNKAFQNFNVSFVCENDCLHIVGEETNKRKLISYMVQEETSNNMIDLAALKESFRSIEIQKVSDIIQDTFHRYHYYINDFSYINLLLHFSIIIDRLKEGNRVQRSASELPIENAHEKALVDELCKQLENEFSILLDPAERFEIYMLFKTNANYSLPNSIDTLRRVVGDEILALSDTIVKKISDSYYINLSSEGFLTPFALHIKNLVLRAQQGRFTKNPMAETIKNSCPTVYDIAIFVSIELMHHYHFRINEDEVGFLALHIGAEIERQKTNETKIQCVLLCPEYMNMTSELYNQLLMNFGNQINIVKTGSYEQEFDGVDYDILLTTIKLSRTHHHKVVTIPPFSAQLNMTELLHTFDEFRTSKKNYILKKKFHDFFSKDLFIANPKEAIRDDVIHMMANKMYALEYVEQDYEEKVLIREKAASTAFVNIAIPHSMEMEALKTCIGVAISKKGIKWDQNLVHIVLLVAINKADKQAFRELYEALVMLFSEDKVMELVKECSTFENFENLIYSCISYEKVEV